MIVIARKRMEANLWDEKGRKLARYSHLLIVGILVAWSVLPAVTVTTLGHLVTSPDKLKATVP